MKYSEEELTKLKQVNFTQSAKARIPSLTRNGKEWIGLCPLHSEKTPSFTIYCKDDIFLYKCHGCGAGGNGIQFMQNTDKISFEDAVEKLKKEMEWIEGAADVDKSFLSALDSQSEFRTFPLSKHLLAEQALEASADGQKWLAHRGIGMDVARKLHLGFIQDLRVVNKDHPWVKKGWISFPYINKDTITLCKYRSLVAKKSGILRAPRMETTLYNINAVSFLDDVFVVEGELDAVVLAQAGYAAVAYPSAQYTPSPTERDLLIRARYRFLAGDSDTEGQNAMRKLWSELPADTYLIEWPAGCKDANDALLKHCEGDEGKFQELVEKLKSEAMERPMGHIYDLRQSIRTMSKTNPMDDSSRLRFPWSDIDKWTPIVPGDVMAMFATEPKTGKTTWLMNVLLHNARNGKVILNYSAELQPPQYARRVVACLNKKDRESLTQDDYDKASELLQDAKFYNGYKPKASYEDVIDLLIAAKKRLGADIVAIDHIHFLVRGTENEVSALSDAMRKIKDFAFDLGVIVIVVGQPRKMQSNQKAREATAQDAKGSEAFGSDASQVFIMHRDRVGSNAGEPIFSNVTKIKLDYSRESETKVTNLDFRGADCTYAMMTSRADGE